VTDSNISMSSSSSSELLDGYSDDDRQYGSVKTQANPPLLSNASNSIQMARFPQSSVNVGTFLFPGVVNEWVGGSKCV